MEKVLSKPDSVGDGFDFPPIDKEKNEQDSTASDLKTLFECSVNLPPSASISNHTVLIQPNFGEVSSPNPYPEVYIDKWDDNHVQLPCSPSNTYISTNFFNFLKKTSSSRWDLIVKKLSQKLETSKDLENAIKAYTTDIDKKKPFLGLDKFLNQTLNDDQRNTFFKTTLPGMVKLALQLPQICTQPIPLLRKEADHSITLSQKQIGCLLANAFLCTFPIRENMRKCLSRPMPSSPEILYNYINFYGSFAEPYCEEQLKCFLNYFNRIVTQEPTGTVTFHRKYYKEFPNWATSNALIRKCVNTDGLIEQEGNGMLQVDFADKFIGGFVLESGYVQEEILFSTCPELIVSILFTERLNDPEALHVVGVERYNEHTGYGSSFKWSGNHVDDNPRDKWGRKKAQIIAIDATPFERRADLARQLEIPILERELNKAYVGFSENDLASDNLPAVATGNWGCGVFGGNPYLKFLLQLMAVSQAKRSILYSSFKNKKLQEVLSKMHQFLMENNITVGQLYKVLVGFGECLRDNQKNNTELYAYNNTELYAYIYENVKKF